MLTVPGEAGKFEAVVVAEIADHETEIRPGMTCTVKFITYRKDDALTVPSTAVFEDDLTDVLTHHVYLAKTDKDGKYMKHAVKTGRTVGGKTEIVDGLIAGEPILSSMP